jgi:hypothetical protein
VNASATKKHPFTRTLRAVGLKAAAGKTPAGLMEVALLFRLLKPAWRVVMTACVWSGFSSL